MIEEQRDLTEERGMYCTVDEMIGKLKELSAAGKGHYLLGCNDEYWLARKEDKGHVDDRAQCVEFGGYL
jgi:membrane protein implicated in regulation of membrane protease activity